MATDNEPDVQGYVRGSPPFMVAEVGISDGEKLTKERAEQWISDGDGEV
jgi:hypothetical protein